MIRTETAALLLALASVLPAQHLRHGVWQADVIVVAEVTGVEPLGNELFLHRLRPLRTLKGEAPARLTIVEQKQVSDRPKPVLGPPRIYCLDPDRAVELPERYGPFYRMTGFAGDHPAVSLAAEPDAAPDPAIRLVEILVASEAGANPQDTCADLVELAFAGTGPARSEAVEVLRERKALRDRLDAVQKSRMLARAVAETEDRTFQSALASLCAEVRMAGVIEALCLSVETSGDEEFARTLGRLARFVHGEQAIDVLRPRIVAARDGATRDRLLLALGATRTEAALDALLRYRRLNGPGAGIDAALRTHGAKRAVDAVERER